MKARVVIIIVALLSVTSLLFYGMYDLTYVEDKKLRTESMKPEISSFGEDIYVVWQEANDSEFFDVYLRKITDGNILDDTINLTQDKSFYPTPKIMVSENNVYILWEDRADKHGNNGDSIYFTKSNDYGQTFGETVLLGSSDIDQISYTPIAMEVANDILYVFMFRWDPDTDEKTIVFRSSQDYGNTFGEPVTFFEFDKKWASLFDVESVNGTIYAISGSKHGYSDESGEIQFRKIQSDGKIGDIVRINKTGYFVNYLGISASHENHNVYIVSMEITDERNPDTGIVLEKRSLFFTKSNDDGNTFEKPLKINTDVASDGVETQSVQFSSYNDDIYIMWNEEYFDGKNSVYNTWYSRSDDGGDIFETSPHPLDELSSTYGDVYAYREGDSLYFITISKSQSFREGGTMYFVKGSDDEEIISNVVEIGNIPPIIFAPKVAIHDDKQIGIIVDIASDKNCILYFSSSDNGELIFEPANLSPNGILDDCNVMKKRE